MYKRILVPLDGSETARYGLREAITLARDLKASVRLLHVLSEFPITVELAGVEDFEVSRKKLRQNAEAMLQEAKALAQSLGVQAETSLRDLKSSRVADVIVDEAREAGCDLIAIGTHGRRGVSRTFLGSDAEMVMRSSSVPVLLVRQRPETS